jgi:hypothetical protein
MSTARIWSPARSADCCANNPELARAIVAASATAASGLGLPAQWLLGSSRKLEMRERVAVRLANPNPHSSQSQLYADMGLIDGLLAHRGGFGAFVHRQLLPPREVREMQARHRARRRPRSPIDRGTRILARYGLTMTGLARQPEMLDH